jgi:hypothetical protein
MAGIVGSRLRPAMALPCLRADADKHELMP